ncbi:hypothetical protein ILUMI_00298 [Ignelater luminosus]|uniref:Uncharacterized protein n=1 Tax=Ignelater luminosus TaxID=2038154 RepID=A0A8K0DSX0_IGNLU|nr:hypothetical protein ILUMI_00298 [Ignelater luminosus]
MKRALTIKELEVIIEDIQNGDDIDAVYIPPNVDILTDEEDLNDDVLLEKAPMMDVAGTFEVHIESSDDDEPIAEPSTSKRKKVDNRVEDIPTLKFPLIARPEELGVRSNLHFPEQATKINEEKKFKLKATHLPSTAEACHINKRMEGIPSVLLITTIKREDFIHLNDRKEPFPEAKG